MMKIVTRVVEFNEGPIGSVPMIHHWHSYSCGYYYSPWLWEFWLSSKLLPSEIQIQIQYKQSRSVISVQTRSETERATYISKTNSKVRLRLSTAANSPPRIPRRQLLPYLYTNRASWVDSWRWLNRESQGNRKISAGCSFAFVVLLLLLLFGSWQTKCVIRYYR